MTTPLIVLSGISIFLLGFIACWAVLRADAVRFRKIACTLVAEAARHKGGKISPHVTRQAAIDLGLVN